MIRVIDKNVCETCANKTCSFIDARIKEDFYGLRTETTVCPTGVLTDGPDLESDKPVSGNKDCVLCGLCVRSCCYQNLKIDLPKDSACSYGALSEQQHNAIACSYLDKILDFSANSNRNKALLFDGVAMTKSGIKLYIEVDNNNDSLESTRRVLGHLMLYSTSEIKTALIVLSDLPKEGSRDVYDLLQKIRSFPTTGEVSILFTTFSILRKLYFSDINKTDPLSLFFNPLGASLKSYLELIDGL